MAFFQSPQGRVPRQINAVSRGQQLMYNAMYNTEVESNELHLLALL